MDLMLLAQTVEAAEKTVGVLQVLVSGGPALIFAAFSVVEGLVIYFLFKKISQLEAAYRVTLENQIGAATETARQTTAVLTTTNTTLTRIEAALGENHATMTKANVRLDEMSRRSKGD